MRALWCAAGAALTLAAPAAWAQDVAPAPKARIVNADFGVFDFAPNSRAPFTPTRTVKRKVGVAYGWLIQVEGGGPTVHWREEFTLPGKAREWGVPTGGPDAPVVAADGASAVTEREVAPMDGGVLNVWTVAKGDPKGRYVMRVTIDGGDQRTFEFDVK